MGPRGLGRSLWGLTGLCLGKVPPKGQIGQTLIPGFLLYTDLRAVALVCIKGFLVFLHQILSPSPALSFENLAPRLFISIVH